eukprot:42919-Rhodomonas_salina.1
MRESQVRIARAGRVCINERITGSDSDEDVCASVWGELLEGGQRHLARASGERGGKTEGDNRNDALPRVEVLAITARAPWHGHCQQDERTVYPANVP